MAFTIPDAGTGVNDIQSILFQQYLENLVAGISGVDCVLSGLAVTGGADMTPAVAKGAVLANRIMYAVSAADVTISAADATNPRIDLIVVTSAGALAVRTGTAAAAPKPPTRTANDVVIAAVYVAANDTAIGTTECIDMRVTPSLPLCIYRTIAAETTNTTGSAIHLLNKTGSGVLIPDGLFLTGRFLRVCIFGNILRNNTVTAGDTIAITYGGTTMFRDLGATALVLDADRRAFYLDFTILAQGNSDQTLGGVLSIQDLQTAATAPTTGIGDVWGVASVGEGAPTVAGSAAVDSDAATRSLTVEYTFATSSASNEIVVEGATVELL